MKLISVLLESELPYLPPHIFVRKTTTLLPQTVVNVATKYLNILNVLVVITK